MSKSFNDILVTVQGNKRWQVKFTLIASFSLLIQALQDYYYNFVISAPDYFCQVPGIPDNATELRNETIKSLVKQLTIPKETNETWSKCQIYRRNYSDIFNDSNWMNAQKHLSNTSNLEVDSCEKWYYDFENGDTEKIHRSLVTEWDLVCGNSVLQATMGVVYLVGQLIGSIFYGYIADRWGRRCAIIPGTIHLLSVSILSAFSINYLMFIICRFLTGMASVVYYAVAYTLLTEICSNDLRCVTGILSQAMYMIGYFVISAISLGVENWDTLQLTIAVPAVVLLLYYWILPESVRWLVHNDKLEEATKLLGKMAQGNSVEITEKEIEQMLTEYKKTEETKNTEDVDCKNICLSLYATPQMRKRVLIMNFQWFVNGIVVYGVAISAANLGANERLMSLMLAGAQVLATPFSCLALFFVGRKPVTYSTFIIGGLLFLIMMAVPYSILWLRQLIVFFAQFFTTGSYVITSVYAVEILPNSNRNTGIGSAFSFGIIGVILTTFISEFWGEKWKDGPLILYGIFSIMAGLLTFLLPETRNKDLSDTVEDVEKQS